MPVVVSMAVAGEEAEVANSTSGDSVLARVERILAAFGSDTPVLQLRDIARSARLPTSTAHRLVANMKQIGWIEPTGGQGYRVGTRLWELASRAALAEDLASVAIPFMSDVHAVLRQHVHVGVVEGDDVLFAERILGKKSDVPLRSNVAGRLPLHQSAAGLVLLSQYPESFVREYCERVRDSSFPEGIPAERLMSDLRRFAQRGYALQRGRIDEGTGGISVPVRVPQAHRPVALGVVMALEDMAAAEVPGIVQTLRVASHGISRALGAL